MTASLRTGPANRGAAVWSTPSRPLAPRPLDPLEVFDFWQDTDWEARRAWLPLGHWVDHWLDVDDRGAVERFELVELDPQALDGEDLGPVEADWVRSVG